MLTKNKLAIIAAAPLGIAVSATAAQAQTIVDPYPTTPADNRVVALPTNPYPNGYPGASVAWSAGPDTAADLGKTYARSGSRSQRDARARQRQLTATSEGRPRGARRSSLVINSGWY
jgi:hypothetical protein